MVIETPQSALLIPLRELGGPLDDWRAELDTAHQRRIPPHVTLLFPFMQPSELTESVMLRLRAIFESTRSIAITFETTSWFEQQALLLEPRPTAPLQEPTRALVDEFPNFPPYEGRFDDIIPHLTVAHRGSSERMRAAEDSNAPLLPLNAVADRVWPMNGSTSLKPWRLHGEIQFS